MGIIFVGESLPFGVGIFLFYGGLGNINIQSESNLSVSFTAFIYTPK
jgi:hypothetical protein